VQNLTETMANRAVSSLTDRISSTTGRLSDYALGNLGPDGSEEGGGKKSGGRVGRLLSSAARTGLGKVGPGGIAKLLKEPAKAMVTQKISDVTGKVKEAITPGGGGDGKGKTKLKLTNIVEQIDVGVPVDVAYSQWTEFSSFPSFMKKVETVDQVSDEKLEWKAQVFWSHRTWESTILDQVPNEQIVWRSKGAKGYVDGAVTFHEVAPRLTRILVVLEYHPVGLFEQTGNIWRAQGRRARLELKHFKRHVMTNTILHPDEVEGWHGEIHDGEVTQPDGQVAEGEPEDQKGQEDQEAQEEQSQQDEQEEPEQTGDSDETKRPRRRARSGGTRTGSRTNGRAPTKQGGR
jgi:uncharacterized membrane protein